MVETRGGRRFAVFFLVAAFVVLFVGRWVKPVNDAALTVAAPFAAVISGTTGAVGDTFSAVFNANQLQAENQTLRKQNAKLIHELIVAQAEQHDNALLRSMVKFSDENSHMDLLPANVISNDVTGLGQYIIVSKGSRDGLRDGMTVLDQNGYFVGSIADLTGNAAKVLLMESPSSSVGAYDLATHARGLVEGRYAGSPQFRYVVTGDKLRPNDLIVTSGELNLYPRGILLGQVMRVTRLPDQVFQTADVRTAADVHHLEMVQVVRNWVPSVPTRLISNH